jgi:hypothetical protein
MEEAPAFEWELAGQAAAVELPTQKKSGGHSAHITEHKP